MPKAECLVVLLNTKQFPHTNSVCVGIQWPITFCHQILVVIRLEGIIDPNLNRLESLPPFGHRAVGKDFAVWLSNQILSVGSSKGNFSTCKTGIITVRLYSTFYLSSWISSSWYPLIDVKNTWFGNNSPCLNGICVSISLSITFSHHVFIWQRFQTYLWSILEKALERNILDIILVSSYSSYFTLHP